MSSVGELRDDEVAPPRSLMLTGVRPYGGERTDVLIRAGQISALVAVSSGVRVGEDIADCRIIAADDLIMLPGLVDLHTHLREPGQEASETIGTGSRAAAAGGYSDIFAMANTTPVTDSVERVDALRGAASLQGHVRVHPVGAITRGLLGEELADLGAMAARGVTVFSDDGRCVNDPALMRRAMQLAAPLGVVLAQHAQDGALAATGQINAGRAADNTGLPPWPGIAEQTIIARDSLLAAETGAELHVCHLSTRRSVEIVRWAKAQGWRVTAEVTPHHLILTDELAERAESRFKVNPPLRTRDDVFALREALADGTIDIVATDHAPHTAESKERQWCDAPFGMTGLETALAVVVHVLEEEQALDWTRVATIMSSSPARIGKIGNHAGRPIAVGEPATFTLIDSQREWTASSAPRYSKSDNTPFVEHKFTHRVVLTAIDGTLTHNELEEPITTGERA